RMRGVAKVYLETSFQPMRDDLVRADRAGKAFVLFISDEVIRELSDPDFPEAVRGPALAMLGGLGAPDPSAEVIALADLFVRERARDARPGRGGRRAPRGGVGGPPNRLPVDVESEAPGQPE